MDSKKEYLFEMYQKRKRGEEVKNILVHEYFGDENAIRGTVYILDTEKKIFTRLLICRCQEEIMDTLPNIKDYLQV